MTNTAQLEKELNEINDQFINISSQYKPEVLEARCIILCSEKPSIQLSQDVIFLDDSDNGESSAFTIFVHDFMSSLVVILESRRVKKYNEKFETMGLPSSPIEQEPSSSDSDSRYASSRDLEIDREIFFILKVFQHVISQALSFGVFDHTCPHTQRSSCTCDSLHSQIGVLDCFMAT